MLSSLRYIIFFILLSFSPCLSAQNLTGSWQGEMSQEIIQINIVQEKNDELCGYTYDYFIGNRRNYCIAYFTGQYNKKLDLWELNGISFIENSGTHVLMRIRIWPDKIDGETVLRGSVTAKSTMNLMLSLGIRENIVLRKVADKPRKLARNLPDCFPEPNKPKDTVVTRREPPVKPIPPKPVDTMRKMPVPVTKPVDTPIVITPVKKDSIVMVQKVMARKGTVFSRIPVTEKNLTLNVYDNAIVDGDTVSIYYNGRMLVNRQRLSEKPIVIELELDEKAAEHEIVLFAHNLGSIPPNTALIVVNAGGKRYELHSSASLTENAVLIFEYKPK